MVNEILVQLNHANLSLCITWKEPRVKSYEININIIIIINDIFVPFSFLFFKNYLSSREHWSIDYKTSKNIFWRSAFLYCFIHTLRRD